MFEEDLGAMQQRLIANGAGFMARDASSDSDSDAGQSPLFEPLPQKTVFSDPFAMHAFPPTPPNSSPRYRQGVRTLPSKVASYAPPRVGQTSMNPHVVHRQTWGPASSAVFDEGMMDMDFVMSFDSCAGYGTSTAMFAQLQAPAGTINPSLAMSFPEDEFINPRLL
jgi:hypothetical protein